MLPKGSSGVGVVKAHDGTGGYTLGYLLLCRVQLVERGCTFPLA
jgi:hypothetical protein